MSELSPFRPVCGTVHVHILSAGARVKSPHIAESVGTPLHEWNTRGPSDLVRSSDRRLIRVIAVAGILSSTALLMAVMATIRTDQAEGAVFASSALAPKAEVIDGVPLIPITASQRGDCQRFADQLKRRVPCPGLLPDPIPVSSSPSDRSCLGVVGEDACGQAVIEVSRSLFFLNQANFQVPPGYVGVFFQQYNGSVVPMTSIDGGPLGHFVFITGTDLPFYLRQERGKHVLPVPAYCSPMKVAKAVRIHGAVAKLYQCSDSTSRRGGLILYLGHDLLVWTDAGITSEVSFHGHSQVNVDLDIAVADATELVTPAKR